MVQQLFKVALEWGSIITKILGPLNPNKVAPTWEILGFHPPRPSAQNTLYNVWVIPLWNAELFMSFGSCLPDIYPEAWRLCYKRSNERIRAYIFWGEPESGSKWNWFMPTNYPESGCANLGSIFFLGTHPLLSDLRRIGDEKIHLAADLVRMICVRLEPNDLLRSSGARWLSEPIRDSYRVRRNFWSFMGRMRKRSSGLERQRGWY
jgi:hypothetical protein